MSATPSPFLLKYVARLEEALTEIPKAIERKIDDESFGTLTSIQKFGVPRVLWTGGSIRAVAEDDANVHEDQRGANPFNIRVHQDQSARV